MIAKVLKMRSEEGLLLIDDAGIFLWANNGACDLLGYTAPDLRGKSLGSTGPVVEALKHLASGLSVQAEGEARLPRKDAARIALHWKLWPLPVLETRPVFLLSLSETAQASAGGPIVASYRDVFEYAVEGIFRAGVDGQCIEVNPAMARIVGYRSPAELISAVQNLFQQLFVQRDRAEDFVRRMLEHGHVDGFEAEMYKARGDIVWVGVFARTVRSISGTALYFEGSVIDITARKRTEAALRQSEERFRRLAETTRFIPFEFDCATQTFTYVGPQAESLLGRSFRPGLTLERWITMVDPADIGEATLFARGSAPAGDFQAEFRIRGQAGREVWVRQIVNTDLAARSAEQVNQVRGYLFEITEAKRIEEERERSRVQLRALAAHTLEIREEERMNVAREIHDELGQALTLLKIDLGWLSGRVEGIAPPELASPLQEKIAAMEQLISWTLQSMRRILSSLRPPLLDELGLKDAIEFHLQSVSKRLAIRFEFDATAIPSLPAATATAVFRIFQEILTNVARHAHASRIKVSLTHEPPQIVLRVEDNGCGITQEALARSKSFGLLGMQERALAIGGELEVLGSPRSGTTVLLRVPTGGREAKDD